MFPTGENETQKGQMTFLVTQQVFDKPGDEPQMPNFQL